MRIISINKATSLDNMLLYKNTDPIIQKATGMYFNLKHLLGAMNGASETCRDNPPLFKKKGTQRTRLSQSSLKDSKMEKKNQRLTLMIVLVPFTTPGFFRIVIGTCNYVNQTLKPQNSRSECYNSFNI